MENTFIAQAYDLDDEWGPAQGMCFAGWPAGRSEKGGWHCCPHYRAKGYSYNATSCTPDKAKRCETACAAAMDTPSHGGIHPRSKIHVGNRLGTAAYNTIYGGKKAATGPTLAACELSSGSGSKTLKVSFNSTLLAGDKVLVNKFPFLRDPDSMGSSGAKAALSCLELATKNDDFAKTGSGQTRPKINVTDEWFRRRREHAVVRSGQRLPLLHGAAGSCECDDRPGSPRPGVLPYLVRKTNAFF
jgi:hypothetical protein